MQRGRKIEADHATAFKSYIDHKIFDQWRSELRASGVQESVEKSKAAVKNAGNDGADARSDEASVRRSDKEEAGNELGNFSLDTSGDYDNEPMSFLEASLRYVSNALHKGAELVMPDNEVARLKAITGRGYSPADQQFPEDTTPNPQGDRGERPLRSQATPMIYGNLLEFVG